MPRTSSQETSDYQLSDRYGDNPGTVFMTGIHALARLPIEQLRDAMLATDFVPCDEIRWSLFGLSLAGYNVLLTLALGLATLWAANRMTKGQPA